MQALKGKAEAQSASEEERRRLFDSITLDQQRVVDISDVFAQLQKVHSEGNWRRHIDAERWQRILYALDEDKDGKIELKHVLAVSLCFPLCFFGCAGDDLPEEITHSLKW